LSESPLHATLKMRTAHGWRPISPTVFPRPFKEHDDMTKIIAAAALILSVAALPAMACPYSKAKADQSASTTTAPDGTTIILKPKANS